MQAITYEGYYAFRIEELKPDVRSPAVLAWDMSALFIF